MSLRSIVWPAMTQPSSACVRTGRVIHWLTYAATVTFGAFAVFLMLVSPGEAAAAGVAILCLIAVAAVGRSFRYILSGE